MTHPPRSEKLSALIKIVSPNSMSVFPHNASNRIVRACILKRSVVNMVFVWLVASAPIPMHVHVIVVASNSIHNL